MEQQKLKLIKGTPFPAANVKAFAAFMKERENIRIARLDGKPFPWTKDPILQKYKFTNVHRIHDRTTRELYDLYYQWTQGTEGIADAKPEIILLNCALFRWFGTVDFAKAIGWQKKFGAREQEHIRSVARELLNAGKKVFTGAYVITNSGHTGPKEDYVLNYVISGLWAEAPTIVKVFQREQTWEAMFHAMRKLEGFGGSGFMAKEVLQDVLLNRYFASASDRDSWTPLGPGSKRGLCRLMGQPIDMPLKESAGIKLICDDDIGLRDFINVNHWPNNWSGLSAHDIQFQLCEFDKYERVRLGQGKPRAMYKPEGSK